ncbi:hypothetical protein AB0F77_39030 [Streptomyces sp. NPDC026672]|uniref:hypothetical protein n=1 Tax=unclassified Streptomyces TaxID=2593676 RepID=UPI0033E4ECFF
MAEVQSHAAGIQAQYAERVTADLEQNTKEQERISAEITALQEQLSALQQDRTVLVGVQEALGSRSGTPVEETAPAEEPAPAEAAAVPAPRRTPAAPRRKKAAATADKSKAAAKKSPAKDAGSAQPSLVQVISGLLAEQTEPRSAAEIGVLLGQARPDRTTKTTVVRTTLENLVAKGLAERSKQGKSVFYTSVPAGGVPRQLEEDAADAED